MAKTTLTTTSTLTDVAQCYLENVVKGKYFKTTYKNFKNRLEKYILPELGAIQIKDLSKSDTRCLIYELKGIVMNALKEHWDTQNMLQTVHDQAYVVAKRDGSPYTPSYISHAFNALLTRNNLPEISFRDL